MNKSKIIAAFILTAAVSSILLGCEGERGPEGSAGTIPISVQGDLDYYNGSCRVDVAVANTPSIPSLQINGQNYSLNYEEWINGFRFTNDDMPFGAGDSLHLSVSFLKTNGESGSAVVQAAIPDSFYITSHDADTTAYLPWGEGVTFTWSPSAGADAYRVYFYAHTYYYLPEVGGYFSYSVDTLLTDTTISFPPDLMFPDSALVDSIISSSGNFSVSAQSGPWQPNAPGNVSGDGEGFFFCRTYGEYLYIVFVN